MLGWTQTELAERASLSLSAIVDCEAERRPTSKQSYEKLARAFEQEAVFLTEKGVELRNSATYTIEGNDWWLHVLDDVYYELIDQKAPEMLMLFSDDQLSPPAVNNRIRKMRNAGIKMRQLVKEDNRHLMGPLSEYRWIPKEFYKNNVTVIYGPKVAVCAEDNTKAVIFRDTSLVDSWRNLFDMLWKQVTVTHPDKSTANERF